MERDPGKVGLIKSRICHIIAPRSQESYLISLRSNRVVLVMVMAIRTSQFREEDRHISGRECTGEMVLQEHPGGPPHLLAPPEPNPEEGTGASRSRGGPPGPALEATFASTRS